MDKKLQTKTKYKKENYKKGKQGQLTQEECKDTAWVCHNPPWFESGEGYEWQQEGILLRHL